jgi:hypothetical protein
MGSWTKSILKEGSDLSRPTQIFGVSHLPRPEEHWHRKKQAVCSIPNLTTKRQIHEFLGEVGLCWICIPNFSLLAKPLIEATKGSKREPLI